MHLRRFGGSLDVRVFDQFCGAGGSTEGAMQAGFRVVYAVNHDPVAVATHAHNFPLTGHDCADVSQTDPRRYAPTDVLITSPECTTFSSGAALKRDRQPGLFDNPTVDERVVRSRATAWDVVRFAEVHKYQAIIVENVPQFRKWILFSDWLQALTTLGYHHDIVYLNAMFAHLRIGNVAGIGDFVPQSRDRIFVVLWRHGMRRPNLTFQPDAFCPRCARQVEAVQSWKEVKGKKQEKTTTVQAARWGQRGQYVYVCPLCLNTVTPFFFAAANVLDWGLPMERIGDRKRPLKPATMTRIRKGLERFRREAPGPQGLLVHTNHAGGREPITTDQAFPTQTGSLELSLVVPTLVTMRATDGEDTQDARGYYRVQSTLDALPTQVATAIQTWVLGHPFIVKLRNHQDMQPAGQPLGTVTAGGIHHGLIVTYNNHPTIVPLGAALPTVTTVDRHSLVVDDGVRLDDCLFRMLTPDECKLAQSFPSDYTILGTKRQQVNQIGNANPPVLMRAIIERIAAIM